MSAIISVLLVVLQVFAVQPGSRLRLADVESLAEKVNDAKVENSRDYEVVMFFDAVDPNAIAYLRLLDSMRYFAVDAEKNVKFYAVSRNSKKLTKEVLGKSQFNIPIGADESKKVFSTYAPGEVIIPVAYIIQNGVVRWKGSPPEIESVLGLLFNNKYEFSTQLKIEMLKRDLQSALQSALPDVIMTTADKILALKSDDLIAIQSKLYVFNSSRRNADAVKFLEDTANANKSNINILLMYLDTLSRSGERVKFTQTLEKAFSEFDSSLESRLRLASFAIDGTPFGWLPVKSFVSFIEKLVADISSKTDYPAERKALAFEILARTRSMTGDAEGAVESQKKAAELRKGSEFEADADALLGYYETLKSLRK